ncbi:MAG: Extradiol ring-cleavage dioxygenase [Myxococcales bacterium]|nr:Extradiol ring-cleavage dioxygenase [Myxococcales bacterium]
MTPILFVSHGAPTVALETHSPFADALGQFGQAVRPKAIAIVSAHWQTCAPSVRTTGAEQPPLIYDFGGFPDEMYRLTYPAPGAPALAQELVDALAAAHIDGAPRWEAAVDGARGWDHGAWVPLRLAYPEAQIPVVQLSLPTASPAALIAMGRALQPFRERGVLLVGSGTVVHNLRAIGEEADWARAFDAWFAEVMGRRDLDQLAQWRVAAPGAAKAHPTTEHFDPFLVAAGATVAGDQMVTLHEEFAFGSLSMRTFVMQG